MIAAVGKPRNPALTAAIQEYEKRAAHYWPLEVCEVRQEAAKSLSTDLVRLREGERLARLLPPGAHVVACDPGGVSKSSGPFSKWLQNEREAGQDVVFLIGGPHGLSDAVRALARTRLALAAWTLPHELARLVLAEQIYRAGTIVRGEPYHK